jgi:hypothetical protein
VPDLVFTDTELRDAVQAARLASRQAQRDAELYKALGEKFQQAPR